MYLRQPPTGRSQTATEKPSPVEVGSLFLVGSNKKPSSIAPTPIREVLSLPPEDIERSRQMLYPGLSAIHPNDLQDIVRKAVSPITNLPPTNLLDEKRRSRTIAAYLNEQLSTPSRVDVPTKNIQPSMLDGEPTYDLPRYTPEPGSREKTLGNGSLPPPYSSASPEIKYTEKTIISQHRSGTDHDNTINFTQKAGFDSLSGTFDNGQSASATAAYSIGQGLELRPNEIAKSTTMAHVAPTNSPDEIAINYRIEKTNPQSEVDKTTRTTTPGTEAAKTGNRILQSPFTSSRHHFSPDISAFLKTHKRSLPHYRRTLSATKGLPSASAQHTPALSSLRTTGSPMRIQSGIPRGAQLQYYKEENPSLFHSRPEQLQRAPVAGR